MPNKKVRALLAYLVLEGQTAISRERLAGILWSEKDENLARQNLRQALLKLRSVLDAAGVSGYSIGRDDVFIGPGALTTDIVDLKANLENRQVPEVLLKEATQPDRILYGLESLDGQLDSWIYFIRHHWTNLISDALQRLVDDADSDVAKRSADALVALDATHEPAHRRLIRYHADRGNNPMAERVYRQLWDQLDGFGSEPDDDTQALIVEIKSGQYIPQPPRTEPEIPDRVVEAYPATSKPQVVLPRIFVHEFQQSAPGEDRSALGSGLRLELISNLVRFRDWTLLDGKSGLINPDYLASTADPLSPPHSYAIYGSLHETAAQTVLVVTLKDLASGTYLWSDRFDTNIESWTHAQRRISMQIAVSLDTHLSAKIAASHIGEQEIENDAFLRWLDYSQKFWSWDPDVRIGLRRTLKEIMEQFPKFAPAYTGMTTIINTQHVIYPGIHSTPETRDYASKLSNTAVKLDPLDARNLGNLGWSAAMSGMFDVAAANFKRALELNPHNPNSVIGCANGLAMTEDSTTGYDLTKDAIASLPTLTPVQWAYIASTFCLNEQFEECIHAANLAGTSLPTVQGFKTVALARAGRLKEARQSGQEFLKNARARWQGQAPASQENICRWFIAHCPVRREAARDILKSGLREADLI